MIDKVKDIISDTLYDEAHIRNEYGEDLCIDNSDEVAEAIIEKLKHYGYEIVLYEEYSKYV